MVVEGSSIISSFLVFLCSQIPLTTKLGLDGLLANVYPHFGVYPFKDLRKQIFSVQLEVIHSVDCALYVMFGLQD